MVYLDDTSHERLGQPSIAGWNRALHARLLDRLAAARARAVVFDIWFDGQTTNDAALLKAIASATNAGTRVVLAGFVVSEAMRGGNTVHRAVPPSLRATNKAGADASSDEIAPWGVVQAGGAVSVRREHFRPLVAEPSLA